jgi:CHAD domain-containing protein/CYTH domain-containing protein
MMEIERKFLLIPCSMRRLLQERGISYERVRIEQFYIHSDINSAERYRRKGDSYFHTVKRGAGLEREEFEEEIEAGLYLEKKKIYGDSLIRKWRYIFEEGGYTFELDIFKGSFKGLNLLEVEFGSVAEAESFDLPPFIRQVLISEVTENPDFSNGSLAKRMEIPAIEESLSDIFGRIEDRDEFLKASSSIDIAPYESGAHALKALLYTLIRSVEANRERILQADTDPERVHQLRVAMRKMRAVFAQLGCLFDEEWLEYHKRTLSELMSYTGRKRDMDVYLEEMGLYRRLVGKKYRKQMQRLESCIEEISRSESETVKRMLLGEKYEKEISALKEFCGDDTLNGLDSKASSPVIFTVKSALKRRYAKILEAGGRIDESSEPRKYHMLRIDVKKLRYMMEFFSSILEEESFSKMLVQLKRIQDILGSHQDLHIQSRHLEEFSRRPELAQRRMKEAIELLRAKMKSLEKSKRELFRESFEEFRATEKLFRKMICRF